MKIHLFQELLELEEEYGHVIHGLERMEKDPTCNKAMRAEKESGGLLSVNKSTLIQQLSAEERILLSVERIAVDGVLRRLIGPKRTHIFSGPL